MIKAYCLLLLTSGILATCQRKVKFVPPPDEVKADSGVVMLQKDSAVNAVVSFKGLYIAGDEVSTFRDCNTGKVYWLTDSTSRLTSLYNNSTKALTYPYESVYAELYGYLKGRSNIGYASEYENELVVNNIIKVQPKNYLTDCYEYEFIVLGNEPFWSIDIIPSEQKIVLKDAATNQVYEFPYNESSVSSQGEFHYESISNDKKNRISIKMKKQACSDGMSDRKYNYSAIVVINERTLRGCAIKKGDRIG